MQGAERDEYAHTICILGEIAPSGHGWKFTRPGLRGYLDGACSQPGTNIKSARNWNAKLEGRRGILFQSFLTQDAARDEYAHALCTLRSMPASRKPRCNENDGSGMTSAKSKVSGLPSALSASRARPSRPLFADCLLLAIGAVPIDPVGTAAVEGTTDQMPL
jgi:hypothetical protein